MSNELVIGILAAVALLAGFLLGGAQAPQVRVRLRSTRGRATLVERR